jgi:hypothetical protein
MIYFTTINMEVIVKSIRRVTEFMDFEAFTIIGVIWFTSSARDSLSAPMVGAGDVGF